MTQSLAIFGNKDKTQMPAHLQARREDAGAGNEAVNSGDMSIPVLSILQSTSDELHTVEGARQGLYFNSVTKELNTSVFVINVLYKKSFALFRDRRAGGGFHGSFNTEEQAKQKRATLPGDVNQYNIVETGEHILLLLDNTTGEPQHTVLMRFKSTGLAVSRSWNSEISFTNNGQARFATVWQLNVEKKSNDQGTWFLPAPEFAGWASESTYEAAKKAYAAMTGIAVPENYEPAEPEVDADEADEN